MFLVVPCELKEKKKKKRMRRKKGEKRPRKETPGIHKIQDQES